MNENQEQIPTTDVIVPQHVLVSVTDKTGLDILVKGILEMNPDAKFYSTGGTGRVVKKILGDKVKTNYRSVEDYTRSPEVLDGRVKTLHPRVHAGILAQRNNAEHEIDLSSHLTLPLDPPFFPDPAVYFDIVVCNLYEFEKKVAEEGVTIEDAIESIDIGGPTMVRGAAKNWQNVAAVTNPAQYVLLVKHMREHGGITAEQRFLLAGKAFALMARYDVAITQYWANLNFEQDVEPTLKFTEEND